MQDQYRQGHGMTARSWGGLLAILLVLGWVRVWMLRHSELIARDGMTYIAMAREWTSHPMEVLRTYDYSVGYPVAIVGMHGLLGWLGVADRQDDWELAGSWVSLVSSLVALAALWRWAMVAYDRRVALVSVLLSGLGRKWAGLGAEVLSDALALAFQMWSLVLVHAMLGRLRHPRWSAVGLAAGAGLCGGLGYWVRPESLWIPAMGAVMALGFQIRFRLRWRVSLTSVAVLAGTAVLVSLPHMMAIGGLSKKKDVIELMRELTFSRGQGMLLASATQHVSGGFVLKYVAQLTEAMHPIVGGITGFLLLAILWQRLRPTPLLNQAKAPSSIAGWLMLAYAVPMMLLLAGLWRAHGYLSHRHVMMTALVLSPLAGQGIFLLADLIRAPAWPRWWRPRSITPFAVLLTIVFAAVILGHNLRRPLNYGKGVYRQAALDLARQTPPETVVLTDTPWVRYYVAQVDSQRQIAAGDSLRRVVLQESLKVPVGQLQDKVNLCHASYVVFPAGKSSGLEPSDAALTSLGFRLWKRYVASNQDILRVYQAPEGGVGL